MGATSLPRSYDNAAQRWGLVAVFVLLLWPMTATARSEDLVALMRRITELSRAGRYAEAIPHAQTLVAEAEKTAGKDHQLTSAGRPAFGWPRRRRIQPDRGWSIALLRPASAR